MKNPLIPSGWIPVPPALPYEHLSSTANLTTRDYFAAKAMQGDLASQTPDDGGQWNDLDRLAHRAYRVADAMLRARIGTR